MDMEKVLHLMTEHEDLIAPILAHMNRYKIVVNSLAEIEVRSPDDLHRMTQYWLDAAEAMDAVRDDIISIGEWNVKFFELWIEDLEKEI